MRKNGGLGKASINHYTDDNKLTLCGKKIPQDAFCYDAFGPDECEKCDGKRERLLLPKTYDEKLAYFKKVVEELGGTYEDKSAWWDAKAMEKRCVAYGKLSFMEVWMSNNWLYFKESPALPTSPIG
jgi:hypothetical protein